MIISENDKNGKTVILFDTVAVSSKLNTDRRYWLRARPNAMKSDKAVFQEAVEACSLNVKPKASVESTAAKVAEDGVSRKIGDLIKIYPVIRGTVEGPYSAYDAATCSCVVAASLLSGVEKKVKTENVRFVNRRPGRIVTIDKVMSVGCASDGTIVKTKKIRAVGVNTEFDAAIGDTVTVEWTEDGEAKSVALSPAEQDDTCLTFDWPAALDDVPDGTDVTFVFSTRIGIPDAAAQVNKVTVRLAAAG